MRIDSLFGTPLDPESNRVTGSSGSAAPAQTDRAETDATSASQDGASLSSAAQQLTQYRAALSDIPEVRQDRVSQLTSAIQSGTYTVSNRQIAESMLNDLQGAGGSYA